MLTEGRNYVATDNGFISEHDTSENGIQKSKGFNEFRGDEYLGVMKPCLKTRNLIIFTKGTCTNKLSFPPNVSPTKQLQMVLGGDAAPD